MATSGNKSVTVTSWDTLKFSWWVNSQNIANNKTYIGWKLELIAGSSGRISSTASKKWSVTVNGEDYSGTNTIGVSNNATKTLASGTTTITHDADGGKTFSYSFSQEFAITFSGSYIGTKSGAGTGVLPDIPRASTIAASNGTLGTAQNLTVTRYSSSFTHTITYTCGTASGTICTKSSGTTISFTPPLSLASQNTSGTTVSITLKITTYSGNTSVGTATKIISCSMPASVKPSCSVSVTDATGYLEIYGAYIKGFSKLKVTVTPTTSYGSAISAYSTTANGATYKTATFTTGAVKSAGTLTISAKVTDKRGRSGTASKTVTAIDYSAPQISLLKVKRCASLEDGTEDITGEFAQVTFSASVKDLNGNNTASYTLEYKKATDAEYTAVPLEEYAGELAVTEGYYRFAADSGSTYNVRLTVTDSITQTIEVMLISTGAVLEHWGASGKAMGIGKIAEIEGGLDIGFVTRFYGGILHPVLEPETDLNDVRTPNTYVGANVSNYNYVNCPISSGTFTLEVKGMGTDGQVKQRLEECKKTDARVYERIYYQSAWGEWLCVSDFAGTLLWSGGMYMTGGHVITFSEKVSKQPKGIVLVFSEYVDGEVKNQSFQHEFIDKQSISLHSGAGFVFKLCTSNLAYFGTKYLYIRNDGITGHDNNSLVGTGTCGISYTNNRFVLRYVIGV